MIDGELLHSQQGDFLAVAPAVASEERAAKEELQANACRRQAQAVPGGDGENRIDTAAQRRSLGSGVYWRASTALACCSLSGVSWLKLQ